MCNLAYFLLADVPKTAVIKVFILDLNDNAPQFVRATNGRISATVRENQNNNTRIVKVTAEDPDVGDNGRVSYTLGGGRNY